ncbi:MAG: hypothetical protein WBF53_00980 [Litorimonas sp.]
MTFRFLACLLMPLVLAQSAYGQDSLYGSSEPVWKLSTINFSSTGLGVKSEYRDQVRQAHIVYSDRVGEAGNVAFVCVDGDVSARVSMVPGDIPSFIVDNIENAYEPNANSRRTFRPNISIAGEPIKRSKWIEGRRDRVVMPMERSEAGRLYNAAVRNEPVRFTRKKWLDADLNMPPVDSAFREFAARCRG